MQFEFFRLFISLVVSSIVIYGISNVLSVLGINLDNISIGSISDGMNDSIIFVTLSAKKLLDILARSGS